MNNNDTPNYFDSFIMGALTTQMALLIFSSIIDYYNLMEKIVFTFTILWNASPMSMYPNFSNGYFPNELTWIIGFSLIILYAFFGYAIDSQLALVAPPLAVQSDDIFEKDKRLPYHGKRYTFYKFDARCHDFDAVAVMRPSRTSKRRAKLRRKHDRETERLLRPNTNLDVQSRETLLANLTSLKAGIQKFEHGDLVMKLVEDVTILAYQMSRSRNKMDLSVAITSFVKARLKTSLTLAAAEFLLNEKLLALFEEREIQSADEFFGPLKQMLGNYEHVRELPIFKKLYKFSMYALSLSLFDSIGINFDAVGYDKVEEMYFKKKFTMGPDFVHCLLDTTLFVCERGYQCMQLRSMQPLLHSGSAYEEWCDGAKLLKLQSTCLMNPAAHGFTYFDFLARLGDAIEKGEAIITYVRGIINSKDRSEGLFLQRYLDELRLIRATELTKRAARDGRAAPFAVLVYGGSSVGKSTFQDMLFCHYGKVMGLPVEQEYKYTRVFTDEFWSGFSTSQWCVVLDDLAFRAAGYSQGDKSLDEMLQIINNVAFTPPQADLPDKGKIPMQSKLVIGTTNAEHLNAFAYFHNALAVQRRLPYTVEIRPKPEFTRDGVFLDSSKVPVLPDGEYPDIWTITLKRVVPFNESIEKQTGKYEEIGMFNDVNEFLVKFGELAIAHEKIQDRVLSAGNSMAQVPVCRTCLRTHKKCTCVEKAEVQSMDMVNATVASESIFFNMNHNSGRANVFVYLFMSLFVAIVECILCSPWVSRFISARLFSFVTSTNVFQSCMMYAVRHTTSKLSAKVTRVLGHLAAHNLRAPLALTGVIKCLTWVFSMYAVYKIFAPKPEVKVQGNAQSRDHSSESIGVSMEPEANTKESVWMNNNYTTSCEDVNPLTLGWNSLDENQVLTAIKKNCCTFISRKTVPGGCLRRDNRAICVTGQIYMLNNHGLSTDGDLDLEVVFSDRKDGVTPNLKMTLQQKSIFRVPESDLAFVELRNLPPGKNITSLFPNDTLRGKWKGSYVGVDENGLHRRYNLSIVGKCGLFQPNTATHTFDREFQVWDAIADGNTILGDCGSPMVAHTPYGPTILGIHFLGGTDRRVSALAVHKADVDAGVAHFGTLHVQNGPPTLSAPGFERNLVDLHVKASVRYMREGAAKVYGSFSGMRPKHKSRVCPTHISKAVQERGYEVKTGAPVMNSWMPWHLALKDMVQPCCNIDETILKQCVESFSSEIIEMLPKKEKDKLVILDNMTAINGAPGVGFIDKMNRNTSMGNPWKKGKKFFMRALPPVGNWQDAVMFDDSILDRVDAIIGTYKSGTRTKPNFCAHLKDEAIPFAKIAAGKTRLFVGGPADWSIVVRKYLLSFVKVVQDNRFIFESGPGTVCQSLEWEEIFEYLTQHGHDNMVAGDYGKFDKKMIAAMVLAAYDIIINILRDAGWSEEDLLVIRGIAMDTAFPLVDFNGDLIEFFGTNPSGHPLTVIVNGLVNCLYMRYCFEKLKPVGFVGKFKEFVALFVYGDDNTFGVSILCRWFNHTAIQKVLADIGVTYTMADKESESVPFINIFDIAFLKRRWRWDDDVGAYLCPLEHASIEKMLTMCVESRTVCPQAQAVDIIESALNEYFYYGRAVFEQKRAMFADIILETEIGDFAGNSTLPTWEYLVGRFWDASDNVTLGKYTSRWSLQRPSEFRRMKTRREGDLKPKASHNVSYCLNPLSEGNKRMEHCVSAPERSSKSMFMEAPGTGAKSLKEGGGLGESFPGIQPPTETTTQESWDYKPTHTGFIQSEDDFEPLLQLSDAALGRLVKNTWRPGQYVKFKRMLLTEHRSSIRRIRALTPEEQMELLRELETMLENHGERDVQSGEVMETHMTMAQNITFADGASGEDEILPTLQGPTYDGDIDDAAQLGSFLARPVVINTFTWPESSATLFHTNFKPWTLYFGNVNIKKKLDNFSRLHCKLKLKFVINASPFYYGALRVVYSPLNSQIYTTQNNDQVVYSQRPGVWLTPQNMTTVEMELPFLTPNNWIDTNLATTFDTMGRIDYVQYAKLRSANSVVGTGITVTCYAWAEDVVICGPTTALSVQSDEYMENGTVSGPASAIAGIASRLTDVPIIGPFARATELGARAAAGIARLFGFSNPPNISDVSAVQPKAFHAMANVDTCMPHDKLSLDAKNEVTISNTVAGTSGEDSLALSNLITRESFLTGALWDGSKPATTLLLSWIVTPCPSITTVVALNTYTWYTPLSYFSSLFAQWRGSIHYKIKFVKTQYHRGRVIISWDPNADIALTSDTETTTFSRIVDLEHEDEVDFIVPFKADKPWLSTANYLNAYSNGTTPGYTLTKLKANGIVTVRVLNVITGPATAPEIDLLLFVKAGKDFMLSVPQNPPPRMSPQVQSGDTLEAVSRESAEIDSHVCGVTVGESVASLRPMLHRMSFWMTQEVGQYLTAAATYAPAGLQYAINLLPKYPTSYGFDPNGFNWATNPTGPVNSRFTYCVTHPIDWVLNAFVGVRGSTVMQVNVHSESYENSLATGVSIERYFDTYNHSATTQNVNRATVNYTASGTPSSLARIAVTTSGAIPRRPQGTRGMTLTNQRTQTGVSAVIPQYSNVRFRPAYTSERVNNATEYENVRVDTVFRTATAGGAAVPWPVMDIYYAAGVDFSPVFFLSTPRLYSYTVPVPVDVYTP